MKCLHDAFNHNTQVKFNFVTITEHVCHLLLILKIIVLISKMVSIGNIFFAGFLRGRKTPQDPLLESINETPSPRLRKQSPGADKRMPSLDRKSPGMERKSPSFERKSPGFDRKSPGFDRKSPGFDRKSPGLDRRSPGLDRKSPGSDRKLRESPK